MNFGLIFGAAVLGLLLGGIYGLMASGLALTFGVMRVINVGHSAFVIGGAYLSYAFYTHLHVDPFVGLFITMPLMFLVGVGVEMAFLHHIKEDREQFSVLITWAIALGIEGILGYFFGTNLVQISPSYSNSSFTVGGVSITYVSLWGFLLGALLLFLLSLVLRRTTFGAALRATVINREAALLVGIDVARVTAIAFGIAAAMAAAGGALYGMINTFNPDSWYDLIGDLLVIIVLGGFNSIRGAFIASLVIISFQEVLSVVISPTWSDLSFFGFLAIILILRPNGLFSLQAREA
jgi:branched-chain amino acid transport system permease protein